MSVRLFLADFYVPAFIAKRQLGHLFEFTALAFDRQPPSLEGLSVDECIHTFALFSRACVDGAIFREEDLSAIQNRLFQQAYEYGRIWRKLLGVSNSKDLMRAGRILYRVLGMDFNGSDDGTIEFRECYFSQFYSPTTCRTISSLDRGIMAGLSGGDRLCFSERMTEGFACCKARLGMAKVGA